MTTCAATRSTVPGRPASVCWSASRAAARPRPPCGTPSGWPISFARHGPRSTLRPRGRAGRRPSRTASVAALRLAQRLGAEPVLIPGQDVADSVIDYARANNVTHLIVGKSDRPAWRQFLTGSITQRLINRAGGINIHVIEVPAERADGAPAPPVSGTGPAFDPKPYRHRGAVGSPGDPGGHGAARIFRHHQRGAGVPDGDPDRRGAVSVWGRRCSPASWRRWRTTSFSCRRFTPSRSPIRKTSWRCSFSRWWRWSPAIWRPASVARRCQPDCERARPTICTSSAANWPWR